MLVSLMNSLNAISMQHNASFALMQSRSAMINAVHSVNPCSNPYYLHKLDNKLALDMANNKLQYQIASAIRENADAQLKKEQRLNYFA